MPRDGSGTYTLPVGNPVVTGTLIETTWANSTLSDIAVQLNNVITRDGVLGPISPFKLVDGAVATPGLAFNSEPGLGWFRPGANRISVAAVNAVVEEDNYATAAEIIKQVYPRVAGATSFRLDANPFGTANTSYLQLRHTAAASTLDSVPVGTGVMTPLVYTATVHKHQLTDPNVFGQYSRPTLDAVELTLNKGVTAGSYIGIVGTRNGAPRWSINLGDSTAEPGSGLGSNFNLSRYNDAGTFIDKIITVDRGTGWMDINTGVLNIRSAVTGTTGVQVEAGSVLVTPQITIQGHLTYKGANFPGAVGVSQADFEGDLNFRNIVTPAGINLSPARGIGWNTYILSGSIRVMYLMDTAQGGNSFGFTMHAEALHEPGVDARFRFNIGGTQFFDLKQNGQGESPGGWIATSDARVKTERALITDALYKISQLTGETYYKTDMKDINGVAPRKAGYIAQMVQAVLPEAVTTANDEMGTLSVDHNGLIGLLIEGVKELHARLDQLEA